MRETPPQALTDDGLLGGRVRLRQPRDGFRAAIDPVLLAAAVSARPGQRVLEAGCGSGAAFLCLAARVPDLHILAVERDPELARLARDNAALNGLAQRVEVIQADVRDHGLAARLGQVAHAFANPPWWPGGSSPPQPARQAATHGAGDTLDDWARLLTAAVAPRGSVTLILPAARFDAGASALRQAGCGTLTLLPVWPRAATPAGRVLLRARRGGRGPAAVLAGLMLHDAAGFTAAANAILRDAAALDAGEQG